MRRIISFDLDGTLIEPQFINLIWEHEIPKLYAQKRGMSLERAREEVFSRYLEVGDQAVEWYDINFWLRHFGLDCQWQKLFQEFQGHIKAYPDVPEVLSGLAKTHHLVVLSNAGREFVNVELRVSGLEKCFRQVFSVTSDFGMVKGKAESYARVCHILGISPAELVHIGDRWDFDYVVPRSLGIASFYLDRNGERQGEHILRSLKEFPDLLSRLDS